MASQLTIIRELPRKVLPPGLERAWAALWDNMRILAGADVVGFEEVTVEPTAGSNSIPHRLGKAPRRWSIVRAKNVTGAVYETGATTTALTLYVASVTGTPQLVVRVW